MTIIDSLIAFIISIIASTVGAICGIGGDIVIKPVFDFFGIADVGVASFLGIGGGPINLVVIFNKKSAVKRLTDFLPRL